MTVGEVTGMPVSDLLPVFMCVVAPFIGSFLGVLILRLPQERSVVLARSTCPKCGRALAPWDLVPVVSWALLGGRCRYCHTRIGMFYPLVELAALFVALWASIETDGAVLIASCVLGWSLMAIAIVDWRDFIVPNALSLFVAVTGIAFFAWFDRDALLDHAIGLAAGYVLFAGLAWLYHRVRGREGLGLGDAKLLGGLGAWVSWIGLPSVALVGSILAICFVLVRAAWTYRSAATERVPFAAFLAPAGWLVWLYGPLVTG